MAETEQLLKKLIPGKVYHRGDQEHYSSSVDRDLRNLVRQGARCKLPLGIQRIDCRRGGINREEYQAIFDGA